MEVATDSTAENKLGTVGKVLVAQEDDYTQYLDASTEEAWATSSLHLLTERYESGWCYYEPEPLSKDHEAAVNMTNEEIEKLPTEELKLKARQDRNRYKTIYREYLEDKKWWDAMVTVVKNKDDSVVVFASGKRNERRVPRAWMLLQERNDHEYEFVEIENIRGYST